MINPYMPLVVSNISVPPDGRIIPLAIKSGLPYLQLRPFTDAELHDPSLPQITMSFDLNWDPSVLDFEYPPGDTAWHSSAPHQGTDMPS